MRTVFRMVEPLYDERLFFEHCDYAIHETEAQKKHKAGGQLVAIPIRIEPALCISSLTGLQFQNSLGEARKQWYKPFLTAELIRKTSVDPTRRFGLTGFT